MTRPTRHRWTEAETAQLIAIFPHHSTPEVARLMGMRLNQINGMADKLKLRKSAEHLASPASGRTVKGETKRGMSGRFQPGHTTWNKGISYAAGGRSPLTRFRKGHARSGRAAQVYKPIGSERISKDGYRQRKTRDDGPMQARWRGVHILNWEAVNGPLPAGHALQFIDGNPRNCAIDNLRLVSRADVMRQNSIHARLPPELKHAVQSLGQLRRRIGERLSAIEQAHHNNTQQDTTNP